ARIVFIGAERRDHDRAVDADTVHRSDHLFTCGGVESVRGTRPRPAGMISIEGVNLHVDDWHGRPPACSPSARVLAEHDPAAAAGRGEGRQRGLCANLDLPGAGRAAELLYAVGVHGGAAAPGPQIAAARAQRVRSLAAAI